MFVPKNHTISAELLSRSITSMHIIPKKDDAVSGTTGVLMVHFFEYESIDDLVKHVTRNYVLVVATPQSIAHTPVSEIEYCDKLNEVFEAKPYTVLSISPLHAIPSEQKQSANRTHIIRSGVGFEPCVIGANLLNWFNADEASGWHVKSAYGKYVSTTCITMEQA